MVDDWIPVIRQIHASPHLAVIAVTGGGSSAVSELLRVGGASRTLLEAQVPYSQAALGDWLGRTPERSCCRETALAMATVACRRATRLAQAEFADKDSQDAIIGVGCTASLASDRPKRGDHRCWIATHSPKETRLYGLVLAKGTRDRCDEETIVGQLLLRALANTCGFNRAPELDLTQDETISMEWEQAPRLLAEVVAGNRHIVWSLPDEKLQCEIAEVPTGLVSGAFDPLHSGHRKLRAAAERHLGRPVYYELAIDNADKPPLDYLTIAGRRRQFDREPLALTTASTFVSKANLFPQTTFVVGFDTAKRIIEPRFYGGTLDARDTALISIRNQGCRFLVAGRQLGDTFHTLAELPLPVSFRDLFEELLQTAFREDISSTQLRNARNEKA